MSLRREWRSSSDRARLERLDNVLAFESANPSIVKSIKQRDLLNTWLRLYARQQQAPAIAEYQPARWAEELPELAFFAVDDTDASPRIRILSDGVRLWSAYGKTGKGSYLEEFVGANLAPIFVPIYEQCVRRALPVYSILKTADVYGRMVACERLVLPFSENGRVSHLITSVKAISDAGGFEIKNLMRAQEALPEIHTQAVIDQELFHRKPARIAAGEIIEFG